jgi:hypothetical protein
MGRRHPYEIAADAELAQWPGVAWQRLAQGRKSMAAVVTYMGKARKVHYPITPSDSSTGPLNHVQDLRRTLRDIGAERRTITNK